MSSARRAAIREGLFWILLACLCFLSPGRGLWTPDEPREAEIGREMYLSPGFLPRLNGAPFLEKPPLYYWTLAAAYGAFGGPSPAAGRALSGLLSLMTLAVTYLWARRHAGPGVAHAAAFMMATSILFFQCAHWVFIDPALMLLLTLAWWTGFEHLAKPRWAAMLGFYGSLALALWVKGPIGIALPAAGLGLFFVLRRRRRHHRAFRLGWGALGLAVLSALCVGAFYLAAGAGAVREFLWVNQVLRFLSPAGTGHLQPFYYYLQALPMALLPWLLPAVALARPGFWRDERNGQHPELAAYIGSIVLGGLVLLSVAATKRAIYLLPLLPPLFLLLASVLTGARERAERGLAARWESILLGRSQAAWMALWGLALPAAVLAYTRSPWPRTINLVVLGALAGALGLHWSWKGLWTRAWEAQRLSAVLFGVAALGLALPILDARKDMAPFFLWVDAQVPAGESVTVVSPDETLYGIIPFTTGRTVAGLTPDELTKRMERERAPALLVEQVDPEIPDLRLAKAGYVLLREGRFGRGRTVRLWRFFGTPGTGSAEPGVQEE